MTQRIPALFVSHGAPTLVSDGVPARDFLAGLAAELPGPRAIVCVSAHWTTRRAAVSSTASPATIHDFYGFPEPLYELSYPAPGAPELAGRIAKLLGEAGIECDVDPGRGLDHGAWVPLLLMYPEADVPVVQLSLQSRLGPAHHLRLGEALVPLRDEGILIVGSGGFTHNLSEFRGQAADSPAPDWVTGFADWMSEAIEAGRRDDLLDYRRRAPHARRNHPSEEHLLPLYVAMGAGGAETGGRRVHASFTYGVLAMDAFAFGAV